MKIRNKLLAAFLMLVMATGLLSVSASAEDEVHIDFTEEAEITVVEEGEQTVPVPTTDAVSGADGTGKMKDDGADDDDILTMTDAASGADGTGKMKDDSAGDDLILATQDTAAVDNSGSKDAQRMLGSGKGAVAEHSGVKYGTLQEALNAVTEGGEVSLLTNVEEGELKFPSDGITLNLGGYTLTIPDGKKGFIVRNQKNLQDGLSNITICNGTITGSKSSLWIDTLYARNLTLRDLTFSDMEVVNGHDGIYIGRSDAAMENCRIENVIGSISDNAGSMIAVESGTLTMNGCSIENCESGGSVIEAASDNSLKTPPTLTMNNCRISYNTGGYCGGLECRGAESDDLYYATITLNGTVITGNRARSKGYSAGGLNMIRTRLRMQGGAIYGNFVPDDAQANNSGADVYVHTGYTNMVIPKASDMKDDGADLTGFVWNDTINNKPYEDGIDMGRNVNLISPMGLKTVREALKVARNVRTGTEYLTLSEAVAAAKAGDALQLCASDNGGGHTVTEDTVITISNNLTIDLNGHHLNGLAALGKIFTVAGGSKLNLIGGRTNDNGSLEANEVDGAIENSGELEIYGALSFKDKILHRGQRLFITGDHGNLRISLAKGKYFETDAGMSADSIRVFLLDAAERAALNDRNHDHEDILICKGGTAALERIVSSPEIDNPHVRRVHKSDGPQGEGLYLVDKIPYGIYLDGVNGDDGNAGTEDAPVRTFEKASELLEKEIAGLQTSSGGAKATSVYPDGIYVMGTVTADGTENWSMPENTAMIRYENLRGAVVQVTGRLTLKDMVIDGHSEGGVTAESALIDVKNGTLILGEGAIVRNNSNTTTVTIGSTGNAAGGIQARDSAQIILDGGAVTGNEAGLGGGIGLYGGSELTMNSGSITGNRALMKYHLGETRPAGGGVMVAGSSRMDLKGGLISGNISEWYGGGISLGGHTFATISFDKTKKGSFDMTAGTVDGNTASANGGGIFVQANTKAAVTAGSITNNRTLGQGNAYFAGGGIYVNSNANTSGLDCGILQMSGVLITDNRADAGGGGIGACPTSMTRIFTVSGAAIFKNEAPAAHDVLIDAETQTGFYGMNPDHIAFISHYMPGGGEARWQRDGTDLYTEPETIDQLNSHTHMTTRRSIELQSAPADEDIQKAREDAPVIISGNYSATRGGGIANNGDVRIGTNWSLGAVIDWDDMDDNDGIRPETVSLTLKASVVHNGNVTEIPAGKLTSETVAVLSEQNSWKHTWENLPEVVPEGIPELDQYKDLEITYAIEEPDVPSGYTVSISGDIFKGYTLVNAHVPETTTIFVEKKWDDKGHEGSRPENITVRLHDDSGECGILELTEQDGWSGEFKDVPVFRNKQKLDYSLAEDDIAYYDDSISYDEAAKRFTVTNTYRPDPDPISYSVIKGDGGTWTKGGSNTLDFTFKRSEDDASTFGHFTGIKVDGKSVTEKNASGDANYTAKSGSVIIELQTAFLETLQVGRHTLTAGFDDGSAAAEFTIEAKPQNSTDTDTDTDKNTDGDKKKPDTKDGTTKLATNTGRTTAAAARNTNTSPKTGDGNNTLLWIWLICASLFVTFRIISLLPNRKADLHSRNSRNFRGGSE